MTARWVRKDYPTIMSGLVVRYQWRDRMRSSDEPEVNASRDGVSFLGLWPIMTCTELARLLELVELARRQHVHIARTGASLPDMTELDDRKGLFG